MQWSRVTGLPSRQSYLALQADDIDPWFERGYGYAISDKASAVGSTASEMKIFARLRISKDL
jgi:hypothetical protein